MNACGRLIQRPGLMAVLGVLWVLWAGAASAEVDTRFRPVLFDPDFPNTMAIVGDIDARAALNFERAIDEFGVPETLILVSDGGLVTQALLIARRVRSLGINTLVPSDAGCYSACAYVFFGGLVRSADGELGVHQISSDTADLESGQISISDILDTLSDFDVPDELLVAMFRTTPDDMYILSADEKARYGLLFPDASAPNAPQSLERKALDFVLDYNFTWSQPNHIAFPSIVDFYAREVDFYGELYSRAQISEDKRRFSERWPDRRYVVLGDTVSVSCRNENCYVRGDVQWEARNPSRADAASGRAYFDLVLLRTAGSFEIVFENGRVVQRD